MWWDCVSQNVQCHSQAEIGHRKICDGTVFHKTCIVTHLLLVIGKDVITPFKKCPMM